jgi:hypothetical protein
LEGGKHLALHIDDKAADPVVMERSFCCLKYLLAFMATSTLGGEVGVALNASRTLRQAALLFADLAAQRSGTRLKWTSSCRTNGSFSQL